MDMRRTDVPVIWNRFELLQIRDNLFCLVRLEPAADTESFRGALEPLMETLRKHIKDVERVDLVSIEKALDGEESERMARDWERAGGFVPGGQNGRDAPPFKSIDELLGASYEELSKAWEKLARD